MVSSSKVILLVVGELGWRGFGGLLRFARNDGRLAMTEVGGRGGGCAKQKEKWRARQDSNL